MRTTTPGLSAIYTKTRGILLLNQLGGKKEEGAPGGGGGGRVLKKTGGVGWAPPTCGVCFWGNHKGGPTPPPPRAFPPQLYRQILGQQNLPRLKESEGAKQACGARDCMGAALHTRAGKNGAGTSCTCGKVMLSH